MNTVHFLPYLTIDKKFRFSDIVFWPFWRLKARRIADQSSLNYLEWYFKKWKENIRNKRLNITIVSLKENLLGPFSAEERDRINTACNILFLLSAPQNNLLSALTSDNFILYSQNFSGSEFRLALSTGSYIRSESLISSRMVNKVKFIKPDYVPHQRTNDQLWFHDRKYFRAIQKAFELKYDEPLFVRFRRSLTPFLSSYSNVYSIGYFDRIVALVTAIEALLNLKTSSSTKFAKAVEATIGFSNRSCKRSGTLTNTNRDIRRFSKALYTKRSKYVHGEEMTEDDTRHLQYGEYYKTGVIFYYEMVKSLLEKNKCLKRRKIIEKHIHYNFGLFPYTDEEPDSD